jgi:hypothetical protein
MDKFQSLSPNRLLFDLASRLGSLEGYLYAEEKVDESYLPNWLHNIETEYQSLPADIKAEVEPAYLEIATKVHARLQRLYGDEDPNTAQARKMITGMSK